MKKLLYTFLIVATPLFMMAQQKPAVNPLPAPNKFYQSVEDYAANQPMDGYSVDSESWRWLLGNMSIEMEKNGTKDRVKIDEIPSSFFSYSNGMLMRVFEKKIYFVVVEGPICYYINIEASLVDPLKSGKFVFNSRTGDMTDYYSETISGEIKTLKDKVMDDYLEQYALDKRYKAEKPKREMKDNVNDYNTKVKNRTVKYIKLINEKKK